MCRGVIVSAATDGIKMDIFELDRRHHHQQQQSLQHLHHHHHHHHHNNNRLQQLHSSAIATTAITTTTTTNTTTTTTATTTTTTTTTTTAAATTNATSTTINLMPITAVDDPSSSLIAVASVNDKFNGDHCLIYDEVVSSEFGLNFFGESPTTTRSSSSGNNVIDKEFNNESSAIGSSTSVVILASSSVVKSAAVNSRSPNSPSSIASSSSNSSNSSSSSGSSSSSTSASSSSSNGNNSARASSSSSSSTNSSSSNNNYSHVLLQRPSSSSSCSASAVANSAVCASACVSSGLARSSTTISANNVVAKQEPQQQQYAAADSNSSTPPVKSFVPCKVCGDKASGYHYGVTSCEGCKGFFRRSIQKQIEYRCLRDGKCLVIRLNRNRCQYCRFKKCLSVGMSRDSVRYGRVPKRSRERIESECTTMTAIDSPENCSDNLAVYDIILMVSQAHHANCDYTEEQTRGLIRKPIPSPPTMVCSNAEGASSTAENEEFQRIWIWQQFAVHVTPTVQRVVEFAKRVPGFGELSQDDQLILIKVGFFELWLSQVCRLTSDTTLTFFDGTYLTKEQMEIMYDADFVGRMFQFAGTFNELALNDTELGLFSSVVLLSPDRAGITDVKSIQNFQDRLLDALKVQVGRNHASEPHVLATVLVKLPELRNIGTRHLAHLDWFRTNWDKLRLPPLFAEIFDIPKCEEDLQ